MKPFFPTAVILVCGPIHRSHLNCTFMLCECIGEGLALEVGLRYWSCISIKISSFGSKVPLCFVHTDEWQFRWIGASMIFTLLGSRLCLLHLRDCRGRGGCLWRGLCALILVIKQLCYISCLNTGATNCATFRNQKLCCGTVFLH